MRLVQLMLGVFFFGVNTIVFAQGYQPDTGQIVLSGQISCIHPLNGNLSQVVVFNVNQGSGTLSNPDGTFAIKMAKADTIIFSTAEHQDYKYFLGADEEFKDHSIKVVMVTDAIWLETVTIIGAQSLEQFKRDVLALDLPPEKRELALPVVNRYARQVATGKGETDLVGPLTYLQHKFSRHNYMKQKAGNLKLPKE